jgi:hypothetical protein
LANGETLVEHRLDTEGADPLMLAGVNDIARFADSATASEGGLARLADGVRIAVSGSRKVITAKSEGAAAVPGGDREQRHRGRDRPAGTGKTYLAVAMAVDALHKKRVKRIILARPAVEAGRTSASSRATSRRRWIRTSGRCTTRWRT